MSRPLVLAVLTTALALGACGGSPKKPSTELAMTDAALQSAETSGARELAPIELRKAREKKEMADKRVRDEEYGSARRLTQQALVDAELAKAKAEAEKSRLALEEIENSMTLMRHEIDRAGGDADAKR